ncbi:MAG: glycosyltransferase, partial [Thermodesulfobacteriota bacterium]
MKKKILVLDTGKEWGGGTVSLIELLKRVDRKRYEFSALFYNNYKKGAGSDIRRELEGMGVDFIHLDIRKKFYAKAVKEVIRGVLSPIPPLKRRYIRFHDFAERIQPAAKAILSVLKSGGFDLIYMNNQPSSNIEGILAAKGAGIPCVQHSRIDVRLTRFETEAVNQSVSKVICVSGGVKEGLIGSGVREEKCVVVYNGIDPGLKPGRGPAEVKEGLGISEDDLLIGTVGSLIKRKRVDLLVDAVSILDKAGKKIKCVVVGEGPEMNPLKDKVRKAGLDKKIFFTGFSSDALSYINAMDVFVLASEKEGLPRVVLEAMLMGRPVVAASVTGPAELVIDGGTGFLVDPASAGNIAERVAELTDSPAMRAEMGGTGRKRVVEGFSVDGYVRGVTGVFEEIFEAKVPEAKVPEAKVLEEGVHEEE